MFLVGANAPFVREDLLSAGLQHVTDAANGDDRRCVRAELSPQVTDVHVERAVLGMRLALEDLDHQPLAIDDGAGGVDETRQDFEFNGGETKRLPFDGQAASRGLQGKAYDVIQHDGWLQYVPDTRLARVSGLLRRQVLRDWRETRRRLLRVC